MTFFSLKRIADNSTLHIAILLLITVLINTKGILTNETLHSDAGLHAMNGAFLLDFVRDGFVGDIYNYTLAYFAKYPALSLGYHPPFFPMVEAGFFATLGISVVTAKLTVVLFGVIAVIFWYRLITMVYDRSIAFFSTLFLFSSPVVVKWSRDVMLEVPALALVILAVYFFYNFVERDQSRHIYWLTLTLALAIITKQTTIFLIPFFLSYLLFTGNLSKIRNKESLFTGLLFLSFFIVFMIITFQIGKTAITINVVRLSDNPSGYSIFSWKNLIHYFILLPEMLSIPIVVLSILSLSLVMYKGRSRRKEIFFLLWLIWYYLLITYLIGKEIRYGVFWVPPFCLFATLLIFEFKVKIKKVKLALPIALIVAALQSANAYQFEMPYIRGYETAARYVTVNPKGFAVLINAYYENNFIFFFRKHDQQKHNIILRSRKFFDEYYKEGFTQKDLLKVLRDYGVKYVIIENKTGRDHGGLEFRRKFLMQLLNTEHFTKVKEIKIDTNMSINRDLSILIYELKGEAKLNIEILNLSLAGKQIPLPIKKLLEGPRE